MPQSTKHKYTTFISDIYTHTVTFCY